MLIVTPTEIPAVKIVEPKRFGDSRGYFVETWNRRRFAEHGLDFDFVQDNESLSPQVGTVRGLHFQKHPNAQDKLIRVLRGRIFDVAVDLRKSSPSRGRHVAVELSAENGRQLLAPIGFAHGFCTLEPDTLIAYKVTGFYSGADDLGVAWDDPDLSIPWPVAPERAALSEKDLRQPRFRDLPDYFD
ncbi:MAG TPA: dTDP-4-dehydrorhamnose 3,5-epimerase [Methylocystis sp.]|nr:dTDP-4-dehydrorhamnose 3,5-epimerase [Methylocystis sp.]